MMYSGNSNSDQDISGSDNEEESVENDNSINQENSDVSISIDIPSIITDFNAISPPNPLKQKSRKYCPLNRCISRKASNTSDLRKGKWTAKEEFYARKLVDAFDAGYLLNVPAGTTLRTVLSERLFWYYFHIKSNIFHYC